MHRRIIVATLFVILALALAGCAPITATPPVVSGSQPTSAPLAGAGTATLAPASQAAAATAPTTPAVGTPATPGAPTSSESGKLLAGTVKHAGKPVPGARVQLREIGWATTKTPPVASTEADANGAFAFANPPAGDFTVLGLFPDGEIDAGGWPPVHIAPGQETTGFVVPLERRLALLSPIAGAPSSDTPTLSWKASDEAVRYRVWVIDAGTTALLLDQTVTGTTLAMPKSLKRGLYQWVVNGLNAEGQLVATGEETFSVGGPAVETTPTPAVPGETSGAAGLPPSCQPRQGETAFYSDPQYGFCFLFPANFQKNAYDPGQINVVGVVAGPPLDSSADPLAATLLIEVVATGSSDLKAAVADVTREFEGLPGITIKQTPMDLGGVSAVLLEGVPGRGGSRDVVAVQNGLRYRLLFMPEPQGFPKVAKDFQALFDAVTGSFTFLPPALTQNQNPLPRPGQMPRLPDQDRAFEAAREALARQLGVDPLAVQRVEVTATQWPDACLGLPVSGEMCAQVVTPGWTVVLDVNGQRYEAHTSQEGLPLRFVGLATS